MAVITFPFHPAVESGRFSDVGPDWFTGRAQSTPIGYTDCVTDTRTAGHCTQRRGCIGPRVTYFHLSLYIRFLSDWLLYKDNKWVNV